MAVVASRPTPPGLSNPSAALIKRCYSRTVRLERPDELTAAGLEATLTIHRHDQRIEDLPYLLRDYVDAVQFIPHWRLTEPHRDLKAELLERPLLSVFRFVRFSTYFVASPRCDTKFVRVTSDVHLCGQVISYAAALRMSLVDDRDLLMEPSSGFVCHVAIRHYAAELRCVVAIPLEHVRIRHISQAEYMMGYYHQLPVNMVPSDFNAVWTAVAVRHGRPASETVQRLTSDLAAPGTPPVSTMDSSPRSVAYITPRGEKTASTVEEYVQTTKLPPLRTAPDDDTDAVDSPPPILPLLCRADTLLTPSDVFAGPTISAPQVLVAPATGASHLVPPAPGPGPTPVSTTSSSVRADDPVIQRLFDNATASDTSSPYVRPIPSVTESISFGAPGAPFSALWILVANASDARLLHPRSSARPPMHGIFCPSAAPRLWPASDANIPAVVAPGVRHTSALTPIGPSAVLPEAPGALPARSSTSDVFRSGTARADLSASDAHPTDIDVPGASPQASSVSNAFPFVSTSAATTDYLVAAFDGGCRHLTGRSAYAWCVWSASRELLHWEAHAFGDVQTNNAMEAKGLLSCLRSTRQRGRTTSVHVFGDSALIVGQALMQSDCNAVHLLPYVAAIRSLGVVLSLTYFWYVRREFNTAADALCNWVMDIVLPGVDEHRRGDTWPGQLQPSLNKYPALHPSFIPATTDIVNDSRAHLRATWSLVVFELSTLGHLIRGRFVPSWPDHSVHAPGRHRAVPSRIHTIAGDLTFEFDINVSRSCIINGVARCVPVDVFTTLRDTARHFDIPFPNRFSLRCGDLSTVFHTSRGCCHSGCPYNGPLIGNLRHLARVSRSDLQRPPPQQSTPPLAVRSPFDHVPQLLCTITTDGIVPPWVNPDARCGVRPLPDNYGSAESGAPVVIDKLLADYYKGRCLVATLATLQRDPGFHSSSFALVAKKDIPLHIDGRIIHDLSAPPGGSVNAQTNSDASPDATWDPFDSIAQRVRDLCRRYPIYAMVADIADAFHHVRVHADHASAFGEECRAPTMAYVLGSSEPFWIFQWVDDIVLIEVDIGGRLQKTEQRLRDGVILVFGSAGWHEGKFTTWSRCFHAVGIDWDTPNELISVPQRKIKKMRGVLDDVARRKFVTMKQLDSLVGVLRHVISFIPVTKPFIQRLVAIQIRCRKRHKTGVPMTDTLQKDIQWWRELVFQNEFAGIPMELFERRTHIDDVWLVQIHQHGLTISSIVLGERLLIDHTDDGMDDVGVTQAIARVTKELGPGLIIKDVWRHVTIHSESRWFTRIIDRMNCSSPEGQEHLR
ncbi:unnamed protein product [Phytophthora fragariaefolia]|uniref:Unnamed protein product n=1 Tax=Phytophthora fragariaefolia TaxID=1490495 RepID=A0A9W6XP51_9STRA|nr:unnamed protein product [Phytophthora fragariaefolia]